MPSKQPLISGTTGKVGASFAAGMIVSASLAGGVAVASIPTTGPGWIYACRSIVAGPSVGATRVIDYQAGQRCRTNERLLRWNATGPRGVPGPRGAPGVAGAPGAKGDPGTEFFTYNINFKSDGTKNPTGRSNMVIPANVVLELVAEDSATIGDASSCYNPRGGLAITIGLTNAAIVQPRQRFAVFSSAAPGFHGWSLAPNGLTFFQANYSAPLRWQASCASLAAFSPVPSFQAVIRFKVTRMTTFN